MIAPLQDELWATVNTELVFYKDSNDDFLDDNMDYWITESQ